MAEKPSGKTAKSTEKEVLSPELVRQIADKVYALWQRELAVENERMHRQRGL